MKEVKRERSLSVQSRVDLVELANLDTYWVRQGVHMTSLSQLVSWSLDMLCDSLRGAGLLEDRFKTLGDAKRYLSMKGLKQKSMDRVGRKKYAFALKSESLRDHATLPGAGVDPRDYNTVHRATSVEPYDGRGKMEPEPKNFTNEEWDEMQERIAEEKKKEEEATTKKAIVDARASGMIVDNKDDINESRVKTDGLRRMSNNECDEWEKDILERDKKRAALENAPLKPEDFNLVKE